MDIAPRPYHTERDLEAMRSILVAGKKAGGATYYVHKGDLNWWLFYGVPDQDRRETITLWIDRDQADQVVGWSLMSPDLHAFDLFVHPALLAGRQVEYMLGWTEERLRQMLGGHEGGAISTMWVGQGDRPRIALLRDRGFERDDHLYHAMSLDLTGHLAAPVLPKGYEIRPVAGIEEGRERAAASHAAFAVTRSRQEHGQAYIQFMQSCIYPADFDLVIMAPNGQCAAFCIGWLDAESQIGLFEPVGTRPTFRRMGLAKALLQAGLRQMKKAGMATATVCVEGDNRAAQRLYEAVGFQLDRQLYSFAKEKK
ncbi:MAG: GNAT family N-acetyltransferase [Candidatus Latescibacteria bacterium]|nr:GNAT family N-acetyltransferase [Candidatus Latescibacterota bacterium]